MCFFEVRTLRPSRPQPLAPPSSPVHASATHSNPPRLTVPLTPLPLCNAGMESDGDSEESASTDSASASDGASVPEATREELTTALHAKLRQIDALYRFLITERPADMLMPVIDKRPAFPHKNGQWSWDQYMKFRNDNTTHTEYAMLLQSVCVVDFDTMDIIPAWERIYPELTTAPMETTKKGAHFFFSRSPLADSVGYYDGARQISAGVEGAAKLAVDFKSVTSTGTAGVLVVCPAGVRQWVRPLYTHQLSVISDELLNAVAKPFTSKAKQPHDDGGSGSGSRKLARTGRGTGDGERGLEQSVGRCSLEFLTVLVNALSLPRIAAYSDWLLAVFAISNISRDNGYTNGGRALAHTMSLRSTTNYDQTAVDAKFAEAMQRGGKRVGVGSLRDWAKMDNLKDAQVLAAIKAAAKADYMRMQAQQGLPFIVDSGADEDDEGADEDSIARRERGDRMYALPPHAFVPDGEVALEGASAVGVLAMLQARCPDKVVGASEATFTAVAEEGMIVRLRDTSCGLNKIMSYPTCSIEDGKGLLSITIKNFKQVCSVLSKDTALSLTRERNDEQDVSQLTGMDPKGMVMCTIYNLFTSNQSKPVVEIAGKNVTINKAQGKAIFSLIKAQAAEQVSAAFGSFAMGWFQQINIQNLNLFVLKTSGDDDTHTSHELIAALLVSNPDLASRLVHAPDPKDKTINMFYCDPATNVWRLEDHLVLEKLIVDSLRANKHQLTKGDIKKVEGDSAYKLLRILARERTNRNFVACVDSNLDLFALENGVFDMRSMCFRPIKIEDCISTTAGWSYDKLAAVEHRQAVEEFCQQVLPIAAERAVVLAYFASMLSGKRRIRKFLAFTDERKGANGKSTFFKLLQHFFGAYVVSSAKFFGKPKFEQSREQHGGGTENFKGKRLVVAEELKSDSTLDTGMLKRYTGGTDVSVEDRSFGKGGYYKFIWQAGFLLIFNEGDCPQFDAGDGAFMERMVVAPFRAKFVSGHIPEDHEPWTFPKDMFVDDKFKQWRSAFADMLVEAYDGTVLDDDRIPVEMTKWKDGICTDSNVAAQWILRRIEITGDRQDFVDLKQLGEEYSKGPKTSLSEKEFRKSALVYLSAQPGVFYQKEKCSVVVNGSSTSRTNIFKGVRYMRAGGSGETAE